MARGTDGPDASLSKKGLAGWFGVPRDFFWSEGITPDMRFVALAFASHANCDGLAWPGVERLQALTGFGLNRIKVARSALVKRGLLQVVQASGGRGKFDEVKYKLSDEILMRGEAFSQEHQPLHRKDFRCHGNTDSEKYAHRKSVPQNNKNKSELKSDENKRTTAVNGAEKRAVRFGWDSTSPKPAELEPEEPPYSEAFEKFWKLYPRKIAKDQAWKSWQKIKMVNGTFERILESVEQHQETEQWRESPRFIPHASTFLNQKRWTDEIETESEYDRFNLDQFRRPAIAGRHDDGQAEDQD